MIREYQMIASAIKLAEIEFSRIDCDYMRGHVHDEKISITMTIIVTDVLNMDGDETLPMINMDYLKVVPGEGVSFNVGELSSDCQVTIRPIIKPLSRHIDESKYERELI